MDFKAAARYLYSLVRRAVGGGGMSLEQATELAKKAHQEAHYLFTDPVGHKPGDYPGHYSGALSDSFTTLVYKQNQRWKMEMGFDQNKFLSGQVLKGKGAAEYPDGFDYATTGSKSLQVRGYRGPSDAMADVGYNPEGEESEWFIQREGVAVMFQGGTRGAE